MKTIKDYHDLYLKCDISLLADVFEKIRSNNWKNYGLCPNHFLRAPALSWNEVLNMSKGELELFLLTDMYLLFEKGMRDGVFYISTKYSKTNDKYLKSYDPQQDSYYIFRCK